MVSVSRANPESFAIGTDSSNPITTVSSYALPSLAMMSPPQTSEITTPTSGMMRMFDKSEGEETSPAKTPRGSAAGPEVPRPNEGVPAPPSSWNVVQQPKAVVSQTYPTYEMLNPPGVKAQMPGSPKSMAETVEVLIDRPVAVPPPVQGKVHRVDPETAASWLPKKSQVVADHRAKTTGSSGLIVKAPPKTMSPVTAATSTKKVVPQEPKQAEMAKSGGKYAPTSPLTFCRPPGMPPMMPPPPRTPELWRMPGLSPSTAGPLLTPPPPKAFSEQEILEITNTGGNVMTASGNVDVLTMSGTEVRARMAQVPIYKAAPEGKAAPVYKSAPEIKATPPPPPITHGCVVNVDHPRYKSKAPVRVNKIPLIPATIREGEVLDSPLPKRAPPKLTVGPPARDPPMPGASSGDNPWVPVPKANLHPADRVAEESPRPEVIPTNWTPPGSSVVSQIPFPGDAPMYQAGVPRGKSHVCSTGHTHVRDDGSEIMTGPGATPKQVVRVKQLEFKFCRDRCARPPTLIKHADDSVTWTLGCGTDHQEVSCNTMHLFGLPHSVPRLDLIRQVEALAEAEGAEVVGVVIMRNTRDSMVGDEGKQTLAMQDRDHMYIRITDGLHEVLLRIIALMDQSKYVVAVGARGDNIWSPPVSAQLSKIEIAMPGPEHPWYSDRSYLFGPLYGKEEVKKCVFANDLLHYPWRKDYRSPFHQELWGFGTAIAAHWSEWAKGEQGPKATEARKGVGKGKDCRYFLPKSWFGDFDEEARAKGVSQRNLRWGLGYKTLGDVNPDLFALEDIGILGRAEDLLMGKPVPSPVGEVINMSRGGGRIPGPSGLPRQHPQIEVLSSRYWLNQQFYSPGSLRQARDKIIAEQIGNTE